METALTSALKEWAIAVSALTSGETILLLRKGGIRETGGKFTVDQHRVWLYPTYEHQKPHLLKPRYADRVESVESGWHPETVPIQSWAWITHIFCVSDEAIVSSLSPFHIWNEQFVTERFNWKPRQPLYVLLLRVHRLPQSIEIPYREEYGGCKSWIELAEPPSGSSAVPVLSDEAYAHQVDEISRLLGEPQLIG
jgi:hypothetical protein